MRHHPKLMLKPASARGYPAGWANGRCLYADSVVAHARALAAAGASYCEISRQLGAHNTTVRKWCLGLCRRPPARQVMRRGMPQ